MNFDRLIKQKDNLMKRLSIEQLKDLREKIDAEIEKRISEKL